jgi:DNA replication protein DnaC
MGERPVKYCDYENFVCRKCNNSRYVENKEGHMVKCDDPQCNEVQEKLQFIRQIKKSSIPAIYYDYTLDSYLGDKDNPEYQKLITYRDKFDHMDFRFVNLYISGPQCTQKTTMMSALGIEMLWLGVDVKFIYAGDLIQVLLRNGAFNKDSKYDDMANALRQYDLLLIDDIFDSKKSVYWKNNADMIIVEWDRFLRYRRDNGKRTVVTSNFPLGQVKQKFGESLGNLMTRAYVPVSFSTSVMKEALSKFDKIF